MRVGMCGASGTGKSTLMQFIHQKYGLPINPVGSRSVSKAMGFESPYDVDKAGKRAEFQNRLLVEKMLWEDEHESFVSDRTTFDNLVYSMLHDIHSISREYLLEAQRGFRRYTHVIYLPFGAFCDPGDDAARVKDLTYQELYDFTIWGLLERHAGPKFTALAVEGIDQRQREIVRFLET